MNLYSDSKWGSVRYRARAGICIILVSVYGISAGENWMVPAAIPYRFQPDSAFYAPLAHRQSNNVAQLWVPAKGENDPSLYIYSHVNATWDNYISGSVSYFY